MGVLSKNGRVLFLVFLLENESYPFPGIGPWAIVIYPFFSLFVVVGPLRNYSEFVLELLDVFHSCGKFLLGLGFPPVRTMRAVCGVA